MLVRLISYGKTRWRIDISKMVQDSNSSSVLSSKLSGGPLGLGDPDDKSLRKVEREVLIPKKMREIAKTEKCFQEVKGFSECCKNSNLFMVFTCRKENSALKDCLGKWYLDEEFKNRCADEYLRERSKYRQTGIGVKQSRMG